ncbi:small secreted hydrophilic protein [Streptomyces sp. NPDC056468]|uniref:small secreted hydrophilic protein n=1 Tax=unclassified Streptomyces TaxID=2593676 RepID=UPI003691082E
MVFSHRIAALAAVVAIPLGIAATSFALTDNPESPKVPAEVELDSGSPAPTPSRPSPTPSDEVVSRPPVTDGPTGDDDDDGPDRETGDDDRGEPGDDG